jgi:hypothetical protein
MRWRLAGRACCTWLRQPMLRLDSNAGKTRSERAPPRSSPFVERPPADRTIRAAILAMVSIDLAGYS